LCTQGEEPIVRALERAPQTVALTDGTPLSQCVARARDSGDLQSFGVLVVRVADRLADRARRDRRAALRLGYLIGAVFITVALTAPMTLGSIPVFIPAFFITVVGIYLYSGPFTAVSQNCVPPSLRASVVTMLLFVSHVVGDSHSTFDVGFISDQLHSLQLALLITSTPLLLVAALLAALALRSVEDDVTRAEESWAQRGTGVQPELEPAPVPAG